MSSRARGGCNSHRSGAKMDGLVFLLHIDFHIWAIKFIIWPAATLACDYPGSEAYLTFENKGESLWSPESLSGCRKKKNMEAFGLGLCLALRFLSVYLLPSFFCFPLFFPSPSKHFSPTLLFAKIQVTMATNWRSMSTSSLI